MRHDLLMDLKPPQAARIQSIVDELFLPLLDNYQPGRLHIGPQVSDGEPVWPG